MPPGWSEEDSLLLLFIFLSLYNFLLGYEVLILLANQASGRHSQPEYYNLSKLFYTQYSQVINKSLKKQTVLLKAVLETYKLEE